MFDWASQPFFTLVTTFVFAPYFASKVAADPVSGQAMWSAGVAVAGLMIAVLSPILGAIADEAGPRKPWIIAFGALMSVASLGLWYAAPGRTDLAPLIVVAFVIGTVGAEFAAVFNNAMLPRLVGPDAVGRLSGRGWAMGYLGGLVSLVLALGFLVADPISGTTFFGLTPLFGLDAASHEGDRVVGPLTAAWFALFVLPLLVFTPDAPRGKPWGAAVKAGLGDLKGTLALLKANRSLSQFLIANMLYTDGLVALFAFGGIYAAGILGWTTIEIGVFGILLTITGTIGCLIGGALDDRFGSRFVIGLALTILILASIGIVSIDKDRILFIIAVAPAVPGDGLYASTAEQLYLALGAVIGFAAGPLQAASRSLVARWAPAEHVGQFYGLFALSGKVTSFMAPALVSLVTTVTASQRLGVSVLLAFFALGLILLSLVRRPSGT
jgi:UMF1 family MFS transporter